MRGTQPDRHGYFYRPGWCGYTASIHEAGRYDRDEAERHAANSQGVSVHDVSEFVRAPTPATEGQPQPVAWREAAAAEISTFVKDLVKQWVDFRGHETGIAAIIAKHSPFASPPSPELREVLDRDEAKIETDMQVAIRAWLRCPTEKRPSPAALAAIIEGIASAALSGGKT